MTNLIVRTATQKDLTTLTHFNQAMALETEQLQLDINTLTDGIRRVLENDEHGYYLVLEENKKVCASLMVTYEWSDWRNGKFWWIQSVYVKPGFRREGCFKTLYQKLKHDAERDDECVGLRLYVEKENINAQNTYLALGMHQTNYQLFEYTKKK